MLQYSSILSGAMDAETILKIGNSSRVVEPETISKNGACPKSLRVGGKIIQRLCLFFTAFCFSVAITFAQDVITLKNGDDIQALVQKIGEVDVKYKKFDNPNGPNYTLKKAEIFMIRYANGSRDVFADNTRPSPPVTKTTSDPKEIISTFSSIDECDAKALGIIFSIGFEVINNYMNASAGLNKAQNRFDFYSYRAEININPLLSTEKFKLKQSELDQFNLSMTLEELYEEVLERIGHDMGALKRHDLKGGLLYKSEAKKISDIFAKEVADWETKLVKAEKALEENNDIIMFITPEYRYPYALSTMHKLVINLRASNYKECADKYEEEYHRRKMEKNSEESIQIQKEIRNLTGQVAKNTKSIARSSRATAIFTGLMYLGW